jgi:hypothetical protein
VSGHRLDVYTHALIVYAYTSNWRLTYTTAVRTLNAYLS